MVKKSNGQWRMCVDFTDLNKACLKDSYPLPSIDRLVDGASGHTILSFLDADSGYNQIPMGIEANPDKCRAVLEMQSPKTLKEIQRLVGRMTALSRFILTLAEHIRPILKNMKKGITQHWDDECEQAFGAVKHILTIPPIRARPIAGSDLQLYIAASHHDSQNGSLMWTDPRTKEGGARIVLEGPNGLVVEQAITFRFQTSNNQAEYEALIASLTLAKESRVAQLECRIDSQLVVGNMNGTYQVKDNYYATFTKRAPSSRILSMSASFMRGNNTPLLKCISVDEVDYVLRELHTGICGFHSGKHTLRARVLRAGYYGPTIDQDCETFVKKCLSCQAHGHDFRVPLEELHGIISPWPFAQWGIDIVGPLPIAKAQNIFLLFGLPQKIVTDNGKQFIEKKLEDFLISLGIKHVTSSVEHPQTNGQAEAANKALLTELKKRLGEAKGLWVENYPKSYGHTDAPHTDPSGTLHSI
ncbi:uncharacterized protein LOC108319132 [Vigna angularis]|uniref:uncharacterized protein LOC108319132 n=1 Tax=Phaseolus angularis TaxID=3914 RepID=UPI00080A3EA3|nr:uncharacterized protein LOC108319132 [Vigna angularis]